MSTPYLGEIRMFGFPRIPIGWHACNGDLLAIAEYDALYTLLGTTYGGDGQVTFAVPDLRGRLPLHQGQGRSLSNRVLGEASGTEDVTLISMQIPAHSHVMIATQGAATASQPAQTLVLGALASGTQYLSAITGLTPSPLQPQAVMAQGGGQPHDNTMPTLTVSYCIATEGIYPSQG